MVTTPTEEVIGEAMRGPIGLPPLSGLTDDQTYVWYVVSRTCRIQ